MKILRHAWMIAAATCLAPTVAQAQDPSASSEPRLEEYIIQKGDSCVKIARRRFGNGKRYDLIHKYNPNMGPTPHRLVPGEKLMLPVTAEYKGADAEVTHAHREVQARAGREETWGAAAIGLDLYKGWRLNTLERAAAEVTFRDTSIVQLRANTLVIIYGASKTKSKRSTMSATLESGALRTRLGELNGGSVTSLEVTTPGAATSLEGGEALVTVDEESTSRVANHGSGKAAVKAGGKSVKVGSRMGSKVKKGKPPTPPKPLPPEPTWATSQADVFVGVSGMAGTLRGSWEPVEKATAYLVQVSRKPGGRDVVASVVVPSSVKDFELRGFAPGAYYVQLSTIDDDKFESPPTAARSIELVEAGFTQPGGAAVELGEGAGAGGGQGDTTSPVPRVLPGTIVSAPAGMRCTDGKAEAAESYSLADVGVQQLSCTTADGKPAPGFEVEVIAIGLSTAGESTSVQAKIDEPQNLSFKVDSAIELPARLRLRAPEGIELSDAERGPDGSWAYRFVAREGAPTSGKIEVLLGEGERAAVIDTIDFQLEEPQAEAPPVQRRKRKPFELAVFGGLALPPANHELVQASLELRPELAKLMPDVGLRFGYLPIDYLALEAEVAVMPGRTRAGDSALLLGARGLVSAQLATRVTPVLSVGGGALGVMSDPAVLGRDFDAAFVFGGGVKAYPIKALGLRLDLRDSLTPGVTKKPVHNLELLFSLSWNFGSDLIKSRGDEEAK